MDLLRRYPAGTELVGLLKEHVTSSQQAAVIACAGRLVLEVQQEGAGADNKENAGANYVQAGYTTPAKALMPAQATVDNISMLVPRGKFTISILDDGIRILNAKGHCFIRRDHVQDVVILDSFPKDTKGRVLLFVALDKASLAVFSSGKNRLEALLIQTFADATLHVSQRHGDPLDGPSAVVLCQMLGMLGDTNFVSPDPECFSTSKGDMCLQATQKVNAGWLFPLPGALCFVERPAMLISHNTISWIELQRIDRPSNTFDMVVHRNTGLPKVEFVQLDRAELGALQSYLSRSSLKTSREDAAAAQGHGKGDVTATAGDADDGDDDSDDDKDEDFDPEGSSSGSEQGGDGDDDDDDDEGADDVHTEDLDREDRQEGHGDSTAQQAARGAKRKVQDNDDEEDIAESDGEYDSDEAEEDDEYETDDDDEQPDDEQEDDNEQHAAKKAKQR